MDSHNPSPQSSTDSSSITSLPAATQRFASLMFFTGFCSLVYIAIGFRLLRPIFGSSTAAFASMAITLLVCLGLGGVWWARRAVQTARPVELLAQLQIGVAISAALGPWIADLIGPLYATLGGSAGLGSIGALAVRLLLSTLVVGIPGFWMGGLLPMTTQALRRKDPLAASQPPSSHVAGLLGWTGLGATAGVLVTFFFAIELFGLRRSLWLACMLNLLLAMIVRNLSRHPHFADHPIGIGTKDRPAPKSWWLLATAASGGFSFALMYLVWRRMLTPLLGDSIFATALVPAAALLGIGLGCLLFRQGSEIHRPTARTVAASFGFQALVLISPYALGDLVALTAVVLRPVMVTGFLGLIMGWTLVISVVVLPAAFITGYQLPMWLALTAREQEGAEADPGRSSLELGWILAGQLWGAALAIWIGAFGWMPGLGAPRLWQAIAAGLMVLSLVTLAYDFRTSKRSTDRHTSRRYRLPLWTLTALLIAATLLPAQGPSAFWRHTDIGSGRVDSNFKTPNDLQSFFHAVGRGMLAEADGTESSVALVRDNDLALIVNGRNLGSAHGDAPTQVMDAMIGTALHPEARRVLVIGLGTGIAAGWLAKVPSVEHIDVLELEPRVAQLAREFAPVNDDVLNSPKVHLAFGDGREWLAAQAEPYDLILSTHSNPHRAADTDLFSRDFYRSALEHLGPDGLFLQRLQARGIDPGTLQGCYATLSSVFPSIETWQPDTHELILVAGAQRLLHPFDQIGRRMSREPWRAAMRESWGIGGLEGFYSAFLAGDELAKTIATSSPLDIATDDRPTLEFAFARHFGHPEAFDLSRLRAISEHVVAGQPQAAPGSTVTLDWNLILEFRAARNASSGLAQAGPWAKSTPKSERASEIQLQGLAAERMAARQAWGSGDLSGAYDLWPKTDQTPAAAITFVDELMLGELLAAGLYGQTADTPDTPDPFAHLRAAAPVEASILDARLARTQNRIGAAAAHLQTAFDALRQDPWVHLPIVDRGFQLAKSLASFDSISGEALLDALDQPFAAHTFEEVRLATRVNLGGRLDVNERCGEIYSAYELHPIWTLRFLQARLQCYQLSEPSPRNDALLRSAEQDTKWFLRHTPPKLRLFELADDNPVAGDDDLPGEEPEP